MFPILKQEWQGGSIDVNSNQTCLLCLVREFGALPAQAEFTGNPHHRIFRISMEFIRNPSQSFGLSVKAYLINSYKFDGFPKGSLLTTRISDQFRGYPTNSNCFSGTMASSPSDPLQAMQSCPPFPLLQWQNALHEAFWQRCQVAELEHVGHHLQQP